MKKSLLKKVVEGEVKSLFKEDYVRGIPDFALSQVASEASDGLKRHLRRYILQLSPDPVKQRQMFAAANEVLEEVEIEIKQLLEDKLSKFVRNV